MWICFCSSLAQPIYIFLSFHNCFMSRMMSTHVLPKYMYAQVSLLHSMIILFFRSRNPNKKKVYFTFTTLHGLSNFHSTFFCWCPFFVLLSAHYYMDSQCKKKRKQKRTIEEKEKWNECERIKKNCPNHHILLFTQSLLCNGTLASYIFASQSHYTNKTKWEENKMKIKIKIEKNERPPLISTAVI